MDTTPATPKRAASRPGTSAAAEGAATEAPGRPGGNTAARTAARAARPESAPAGAAGAAPVDDGLEAVVFDVFARGCPSRPTMEHVTGRWGGLVLVALADGDLRFNALRRRVDGISEKMLAQALHALERDGLVVREVKQAIPPNVEYRLTGFGSGVVERLQALIGFVESNMAGVLAAQERYDRAKAAAADA